MQKIVRAIVPWVLLAGPAFAAELSERTIKVTGTAVVKTPPDIVVWNLKTVDQDKNLLLAKERSDKKLAAILGLRQALGVKDEDLQTGNIVIEKVYERDRSGNQGEFKWFSVTREVSVRERDLRRFDEFLTRFVTSSEVELSFAFEASRFVELRKQARLQALAVAKEKAAAMTEALGARAGRVLNIEEVEGPGSGWYGQNIMNRVRFEEELPGSDAVSGTFAPGAIEIRVSVRTTFAIE